MSVCVTCLRTCVYVSVYSLKAERVTCGNGFYPVKSLTPCSGYTTTRGAQSVHHLEPATQAASSQPLSSQPLMFICKIHEHSLDKLTQESIHPLIHLINWLYTPCSSNSSLQSFSACISCSVLTQALMQSGSDEPVLYVGRKQGPAGWWQGQCVFF